MGEKCPGTHPFPNGPEGRGRAAGIFGCLCPHGYGADTKILTRRPPGRPPTPTTAALQHMCGYRPARHPDPAQRIWQGSRSVTNAQAASPPCAWVSRMGTYVRVHFETCRRSGFPHQRRLCLSTAGACSAKTKLSEIGLCDSPQDLYCIPLWINERCHPAQCIPIEEVLVHRLLA
jgi:hypothetical protein